MRHIRQFLRTVFAIERREDTGVLDVRTDAERALLYFRSGKLIFVEQSNLGRTIGAYLVGQGLLSRADYAAVVAEIAGPTHESPLLAFVEQAIAKRLLEPSVANAILTAQVERNFIRCLGWDADYCRFQADPDVLRGRPVFPCDLAVIVLEGLREHLGMDEKIELLGRYGARLPRLSRSPDDLAREFRLQPREERFLRRLDHFVPLEKQLPEPYGSELTLVIALHLSGRLSFSRGERRSSTKLPIVDERPREEKLTDNRIRLTLPQPPSEEEVRAAAAFQRGKRLVHDDPRDALAELRAAAEIVPRPDYVLYALWAEYASQDEARRRELFTKLEDATRRALEWDSTFAFGYFVVGHLHIALDDLESARLAFERAHRLDPTDPAPGFEIAAIKAGRYDKA